MGRSGAGAQVLPVSRDTYYQDACLRVWWFKLLKNHLLIYLIRVLVGKLCQYWRAGVTKLTEVVWANIPWVN